MKYDEPFGLSDLLVRKAAGEITDSEQYTLDRWLSGAPERRELYERIMSGRTLEKRKERLRTLDTGSTIRNIDRKVRRHRLRRISVRAGTAAAVLLAGVFSLLYFNSRSGTIGAVHVGHSPLISLDGGAKASLATAGTGTEWEEYLKTATVSAAGERAGDAIMVRIEVPRGGDTYKLKLGDGSTVWLNSGTVIEYPETFAGDGRDVRLSGEAFFDVATDRGKPFRVSTAGNIGIEVLGTSFNVTAYPEEGKIRATLVSGSVEVTTPHGSAKLSPGDEAVIEPGERDIAVEQVDASLAGSWTTGVFDFEGVKLSEICARLSRWYEVEFVFEGGTGDERFSGRARMNAPLHEFLESMELVTDVVFREKQGRITVMPGR